MKTRWITLTLGLLLSAAGTGVASHAYYLMSDPHGIPWPMNPKPGYPVIEYEAGRYYVQDSYPLLSAGESGGLMMESMSLPDPTVDTNPPAPPAPFTNETLHVVGYPDPDGWCPLYFSIGCTNHGGHMWPSWRKPSLPICPESSVYVVYRTNVLAHGGAFASFAFLKIKQSYDGTNYSGETNLVRYMGGPVQTNEVFAEIGFMMTNNCFWVSNYVIITGTNLTVTNILICDGVPCPPAIPPVLFPPILTGTNQPTAPIPTMPIPYPIVWLPVIDTLEALWAWHCAEYEEEVMRRQKAAAGQKGKKPWERDLWNPLPDTPNWADLDVEPTIISNSPPYEPRPALGAASEYEGVLDLYPVWDAGTNEMFFMVVKSTNTTWQFLTNKLWHPSYMDE